MSEAPSLVLSVPSAPNISFQTVSAGVTSFNGLIGGLTLSGAGSVYVTNDGRYIIVSGSANAGGGGTGAVTQNELWATGTVLNVKIDALSGWVSNALTQTGATLIALINGLGTSGVTSVNSATGAISLTGAGSVSIFRNGNTFTISGLVSGGSAGDVTFSQLAATGSYLESLITGQSGYNATSYALRSSLISPFTYTSGTTVNLSIDSTGASQNLGIYITGVSTNLTITNQYNGANGVIILNKLYGGTGSITLPTGSYIVNNPGTNVVALSTGASGYDVLSFVYDANRPYWAVSTLSGAAITSSVSAGSGTLLNVTGSSYLANATITGVGGVVVSLVGPNLIRISGGTAAGTVTQSQLDALSGFSLTPPQTNLAGGTSLNLNTIYYDSFSANRALTFNGSPAASSFVTLRANVTSYSEVGFPSSYRVGQLGTVTGLAFSPGNHEISWLYSDSKWWLADSSGPLSNFSANRGPIGTDDYRTGYSAGSRWIDTSVTGLYECVDSSSGNAVWIRINNPTGIFTHLYINGVQITGNGGGGGVSTSQLEATGQALMARDLVVSGTVTTGMSPPFIIQSGASISLTIDSTKAMQNLKVIVTGTPTPLTINGVYNGANGIMIVDKRYAGTGQITLPVNSYVVNGVSGILPLFSGANTLNVFSFAYDETRAYWVGSTITGAPI